MHGLGHSSLNSNDNPLYAIGDDPDEMGDNLPYVDLPSTIQANAIYMAYGHVCITTQGNELYCWGENRDGQLGLGDDDSRGDGFYIREYAYDNGEKTNRKKEIVELDGTELGRQLCSLSPNNGGLRGRIYIDANTNDILDDNEDVLIERTVCDTDDRTAFLSGRLYSYQARLEYGQFGSDFSEMGDALQPVQFGTSSEIKDVSIGYYVTCVLFEDNELKCFGDGDTRGADTGEDAGDTPLNTPNLIAPVDLGTDKIIADIASAGYQTCAAFVDATVKCWGYNEYGEAGYPEYEGEYIGDGDPEPEMGEHLPFVDVR
jgi:alpha-tubulin suppressor-like RCC1 family protein